MFRSISTFMAGSVLAALLFAPAAARATSMLKLADEDLSRISDAIVVADVVRSESTVKYARSGNKLAKQITTQTTLKVVDSWKGTNVAGDTITVGEIGGVVDKEMTVAEGTAGFLTGERVLVFLEYRPNVNEYRLVSWSEGKYTLLSNERGGWDVAKIRIPVDRWGTPFVKAEHENRALRNGDLLTMQTKVKRIVAADAANNVNWRDLPQYQVFAGKKGGRR